ncbi:MAG: SoxR reducing system RseC family protein [Clostridia bacterium]|nr:SoxR reducing system RseC family protein [Clostridia bacterium]
MLRTGKVVAANGGELEVCFERPEACAHCGQCGGQKEKTLVKLPGDVPVGRWIDVDMPEGQVLKASVLAYVLPLVMLLGGLALGSLLFAQEALWAVTGILCMGLAWLILRLIEKRMKKKDVWQPQIVNVYGDGEEPGCPTVSN